MKAFFASRILPAVTLEDQTVAIRVAEAILEGGLNIMEVPFRTKDAAASIKSIKDQLPEMIIGAGTILSVSQLHEAQASGAQFGLAPGYNPAVVREAKKLGFPFIPGVMTPSEVELALEAGCLIQKLFPAAQLGGVAMLKALHGPYRHTGVQFIPMGGVSLDNMQEYLSQQNVLAIGGSWLAGKKLLQAGDYESVRRNTAEAVGKVEKPPKAL